MLFFGIWEDDLAEMIDGTHWHLFFFLQRKALTENKGANQAKYCVVNAKNSVYLQDVSQEGSNQALSVI